MGANRHISSTPEPTASDISDEVRESQKAFLKKLVDNTGLTLTDIARQAGLTPSTLTRIANDPDNKTVLGGTSMARLERLFADTAHGIGYGGIVEAGAFRPVNLFDQDSDYRVIPIAPDPRYPAHSQFAFRVEGDSMNRAHIEPGMWVHAIDYAAWQRRHGEPGDGDLVVVTRVRDGHPERELTVKQLRIFRDRMELRPQSTNPKHEVLVMPAKPQPGVETIDILAVVVAATWLFSFAG